MGKRAPAPPAHAYWITCRCGKRGFFTRTLAKQSLARARRNERERGIESETMHIFRCDLPNAEPVYHVGFRNPQPNLNETPGPKPRSRHQ